MIRCRRRFGRFPCGGVLEHQVNHAGELRAVCPRCTRYARGLCLSCPRRRDGKKRRCAPCDYQAHLRRNARWARRHPTEHAANVARWRGRHREQARAISRAWQRRHAIAKRAYDRRYFLLHRERLNALRRARRARQAAA